MAAVLPLIVAVATLQTEMCKIDMADAITAAIYDQADDASPPPQSSQSADSSPSLTLSNKLAQTIQDTPVGSLGPAGTNRAHYRYYDSLFYAAMQFGKDAKSSIEVGCASDPFLKYLSWIDERTCVAPYFVDYDGKTKNDTTAAITRVTADFMKYELPNNEKFDLLICSQVLEHVPDPSSFMKKLIDTAKTSVISVPFDWEDCGKVCNHVTHHITYEVLSKWCAPHKPIYRAIVTEGKSSGSKSRRLIVVYKNE